MSFPPYPPDLTQRAATVALGASTAVSPAIDAAIDVAAAARRRARDVAAHHLRDARAARRYGDAARAAHSRAAADAWRQITDRWKTTMTTLRMARVAAHTLHAEITAAPSGTTA